MPVYWEKQGQTEVGDDQQADVSKDVKESGNVGKRQSKK